MGKLHARGNGITEDIDFNWLYQMYGMEYKNWSILAQRWLKLQPKALSSRRNSLSRFFRSFLVPLKLPTNPLIFFDRNTNIPDFFEECIHPSRDDQISITHRQAVTYNNYVREFLDFSLQELVGIEDDFGHNTIPNQYRNPLKKKTRSGITVSETIKTPLPYNYIQELREVICSAEATSFKDWKWAQEAGDAISLGKSGGDWYEVTSENINFEDPNCVWRKRIIPKGKIYQGLKLYKDRSVLEMWCPANAVALYVKLELPLRTSQVRWLDSGEADLWRYENGNWILNSHHLAPVTKIERANYSIGRGVFRKVSDLQNNSTSLFINTNKTADVYKDGMSKGYTIPWQHERVLKWLEALRNWQEKYNPIERPTRWTELKRKNIGDLKSEQQLKEMPPTCFLFRNRAVELSEDFAFPVSDKDVMRLWFKLLKNLEQRCFNRGETLTNGEPIQFVKPSQGIFTNYTTTFFPLHSLRVSLITSFALEGGVPIPILSKLVAGHSRIIMTLYYTKVGQAYMQKVMNEAESKLELTSKEKFKEFLINSEYEQIKSSVAFQDISSLNAIASKTEVSWQMMDRGICPVGCQGCENGGEQFAKLGNAPISYSPVARDFQGNSKNCVRCRWFITGPAFLPSLIVHFNNLSYESSCSSDRYRKFESELEELKLKKFTSEDRKEIFYDEQKLKNAEFQYEREATKIDSIMNDMHATYKLVSQCIQIMNQNSDKKIQLIGNQLPEDITINTEEVSEFSQLEIICRHAEFYPSYDATKAALKRGQAIDLMLKANQQDPILLYLSEEEQLKVGNQIMILIENRVGSFEGAIKFIESQGKLSEINLLDIQKLALNSTSPKHIQIKTIS
ncbi:MULTISPECIES: integrase family protein [unclassified Acinetobacter]|uniref:gamma-mobile-trio integrase GmtZ n=1 Tax=unclassified Acinetobacter TaxID=196816 RepID=UPI001C217CE2|nr:MULTISPECIES: integrase family protein [unclassified Acinetobacter]